MPAIEFGDIDAALAPVPAWRFSLTLPTISGLSVDGDVLTLMATRFVASHRGIDYEQVPFNAGSRNFPVGHHVDQIAATFVEDQRFTALQYLNGWIALVIDEQGNFGLPADWKRQLSVDYLDETGRTIATKSWPHCGPTRPDQHESDGTATGFLTTSCSFVVDVRAPLVVNQ